LKVGPCKFEPDGDGTGLFIADELQAGILEASISFQMGIVWEDKELIAEDNEPAQGHGAVGGASAPPVAPAPQGVGYDTLTYVDLQLLLKDRGIPLPSSRKKADIVKALQDNDQLSR